MLEAPINEVPEQHSGTRFDANLKLACQRSKLSGKPIVQELEDLIGETPEAFLSQLSEAMCYRSLASIQLFSATPRFDKISLTSAISRECVCVQLDSGETLICHADPFDREKLDWLEQIFPTTSHALVSRDDISAYLSRCEENFKAIDQLTNHEPSENEPRPAVEQLSLSRINEDASQVVRLVNSTLYDGLKAHASDIHLESTSNGLVIKYRIDGALSVAKRSPGTEIAEQIISRIKVLAELDIAERRVPQDGRFKVAIKDREIDFRVSIMPSIFGEDAVLRILDKQNLTDSSHRVQLDALGFDQTTGHVLRSLAQAPYGMVLVTGPTGSGKTTTLYAMISEINRGEDKIVTIEDPVEYQLPGILQIPVNEKKGLTFARGLRSILRHDPDRIMVGEIRDPETAQIAVQSALTGHLVFSTIHANNVFDVLGRFVQMDVDPYSFVSALNGILAQRLIRLLCSSCAQPVDFDKRALELSGVNIDESHRPTLFRANGCGHCRGTGFNGRTAIAEYLIFDDELRQLIVDRQPIAKIKEYSRTLGMRPLRESAVELAMSGRTTFEEINRVTFVT